VLDQRALPGKACDRKGISIRGQERRVIKMSDSSNQKLSVVINHLVSNFDVWKLNFDEHELERSRAGITGHHLNREMDNPKHVTALFPCKSRAPVEEFFASDAVYEYMQQAGVIGTPTTTWIETVRKAAIWDRQLPAALIIHPVDDLDRWLAGYDAADDLRKSAGILGHAANSYIDDPSMVITYHQAETFKELRDFLSSEELITLMQRSGVSTPPEITYHLGDYGTRYGDSEY
jgi:hypothetical protein